MSQESNHNKTLLTILVVVLCAAVITVTVGVVSSMMDEGTSRSQSYNDRAGTSSYTGYDSYISVDEPFDRLSFSGFLYEKSKHFPTNASISGSVYNGNNFSITGYFYIIFDKGGRTVHRELVSVGTIGPNKTGTWSDSIYSLDYDTISYEDSTIIKK